MIKRICFVFNVFFISVYFTACKKEHVIPPKTKSESKPDLAHYRYTYIAAPQYYEYVKVYIDPAVPEDWRGSVNEAVKNWSVHNTGSGVNFSIVPSGVASDIIIEPFYNATSGVIGEGELPSYDGKPGEIIKVNTYYNWSNAGTQLIATIVHELGHNLGFLHTDNVGNPNGYTYFINGSLVSDPNSVFKSASGSWNGWSSGDITAIKLLFPERDWYKYGYYLYNYIGSVKDISANLGGVYAINNTPVNGGYQIYKESDFSGWQLLDGGAIAIASGKNVGEVWVISNNYNIYRRDGNSWTNIPGQAQDISIGAEGSVYITGYNATGNGGIFKYNGSGWTEIGGGAKKIAVNPQGIPWIISADGAIWRKNGTGWNTWTQMPGNARDISISTEGTVYIIGTNSVSRGYGVYKWNGSAWITYSTQATGAVTIAGNSYSNPYIINDQGLLYFRSYSFR